MGGHSESRRDRVARWRRMYWERVKRIKSDTDQIGLAADHLRIAINKCAPADQRGDIIATAVADLVAPAEELLTRFERKAQ